MSTAYIATRLRETDKRTLHRALYGHTQVVGSFHKNGHFYAVLETTADTDERAKWLAEYQAGRLQSFPFFASVHDTVYDAVTVIGQLVSDSDEPFSVIDELDLEVSV